ncbi:MAG: ATP-dependent Clp protease ATP-binding subunit, partial [Pedobacter sp.]
ELKSLFGRVNTLGYEVKLTETAKEFIAEKGFDSAFGARPLKRAIQKYLEDPIAEEILKGDIAEGDILEIDYDKEKEEITVVNKSNGKKKKKEEGA